MVQVLRGLSGKLFQQKVRFCAPALGSMFHTRLSFLSEFHNSLTELENLFSYKENYVRGITQCSGSNS